MHQLGYFGASPRNIGELRDLGPQIPNIERFVAYFPVTDNFGIGHFDTVRDRSTVEILRGEWLFHNSQSWIASRTRRTFASFVRAGAVEV
jgi:hypothetical protein